MIFYLWTFGFWIWCQERGVLSVGDKCIGIPVAYKWLSGLPAFLELIWGNNAMLMVVGEAQLICENSPQFMTLRYDRRVDRGDRQ